MIFRLTQKLATKIKVVPVAPLPPHEDPFLDWTAHLIMVSRWQCILFTNSRCFYSIVMAGKSVANEKAFVEKGLSALREYMALDGCANLFDAHIAPNTSSIRICKASDRCVLGSMNDLIYQVKGCLLEAGLPLQLVNVRLNETPLSMLKHHNPKLSLLALEGQSEE